MVCDRENQKFRFRIVLCMNSQRLSQNSTLYDFDKTPEVFIPSNNEYYIDFISSP
jgi:hypothetical protein